MTKIYGYIISGSRCKQGRFRLTLKEAKKEMNRQMRAGARESGIMEVVDKKTADLYLKKEKKKSTYRVVKTGRKTTLTRRKSINKSQGKYKRQLARVIVYDDGGKTVDRYTIITPDGSVYGMSSDPFSPQGYSQYVGEKNEFPHGLSHTGKKINVFQLPEIIQKAILQRMKE